jgi:hypothetical protein
MRVITGAEHHRPVGSLAIVLGSVALLSFSVLTDRPVKTTGPIIAAILIVAIAYRRLLSWRWLLALIVLVILFVPIKRYTLPASLPFNLELYRLLVAFVAIGWLTSLLIDPRVRIRRSGLDAPLMWFFLLVFLSLLANSGRVASVSGEVYKKLLFFASFFLLFYIVVSVVRRARDIEFLVRILAGGGAIVAASTVVERRTGYNVFDHLSTVLPFLHLEAFQVQSAGFVGGRLRVFASAQHSIALGAALAMLLPLAVYRARTYREWYWWVVATVLGMGALATGSRTGVIMLVVEAVVFVMLRPRDMARLWPLLIPALLFVKVAAPGSLGTLHAFFPRGGIINEQQNAAVGSGRLATLGPALHTEFKPNPLVGEGFGTRITKRTEIAAKNGPILDDQWLGILLETGLLGAVSLLWMFLRFMRQLGGEARRDQSPRGWLLTSIIASVAAFAAGMFLYDAFSFIQVTFLLFLFLGLGVSARLCPAAEWEAVSQRKRMRSAFMHPAPSPP